jgi:hypothetical protein
MTKREEPGKQKTRRRRAQELSRSCAQENAWWKWNTDRIVQLALGGRPELCAAAHGTVGREGTLWRVKWQSRGAVV